MKDIYYNSDVDIIKNGVRIIISEKTLCNRDPWCSMTKEKLDSIVDEILKTIDRVVPNND